MALMAPVRRIARTAGRADLATAVALALLTTVAPVRPAAAQLPLVTASAECVGGALGCTQVDFMLSLVGGSSIVDYFRLSLPTPITGGPPEADGLWRFALAQAGEAEDALGANFFASTVTDGGLTLAGTFEPSFLAIVAPTLRVRASMTVADGGAPSRLTGDVPPSFSYEVGAGGAPAYAGAVETFATVPEPAPVALVTLGMLAMAAWRIRRQ